jgi:hypothetical protein
MKPVIVVSCVSNYNMAFIVVVSITPWTCIMDTILVYEYQHHLMEGSRCLAVMHIFVLLNCSRYHLFRKFVSANFLILLSVSYSMFFNSSLWWLLKKQCKGGEISKPLHLVLRNGPNRWLLPIEHVCNGPGPNSYFRGTHNKGLRTLVGSLRTTGLTTVLWTCSLALIVHCCI